MSFFLTYGFNKMMLVQFLGELVQATTNVLAKWKKLLKYYLAEIDEEVCIWILFINTCWYYVYCFRVNIMLDTKIPYFLWLLIDSNFSYVKLWMLMSCIELLVLYFQIEVILKLEEICESTKEFAPVFDKVCLPT